MGSTSKLQTILLEWFRWIASDRGSWVNIFGDHAARSYDGLFAYCNPREYKCPGTNKRVGTDGDLRDFQGQSTISEIMSSCAKIHFLSDSSPFMNFNVAKAVCVGTVTEAGTMVHSQIPGERDTGTLVNEGSAIQFSPEEAENTQAPRI